MLTQEVLSPRATNVTFSKFHIHMIYIFIYIYLSMTSIHVRVYVRLYELMSHITHMSHTRGPKFGTYSDGGF